MQKLSRFTNGKRRARYSIFGNALRARKDTNYKSDSGWMIHIPALRACGSKLWASLFNQWYAVHVIFLQKEHDAVYFIAIRFVMLLEQRQKMLCFVHLDLWFRSDLILPRSPYMYCEMTWYVLKMSPVLIACWLPCVSTGRFREWIYWQLRYRKNVYGTWQSRFKSITGI